MIDFAAQDFHPVVVLPDDYDVLDMSIPPERRQLRRSAFSVGRYNEVRPGSYETELFDNDRNIHVGIDIGAPLGTPVHCFADGWIESFGYNPADGDYGHTVVTGHRIDGVEIYALFGHLDARSTLGRTAGRELRRGALIGHLGAEHENGGWPPHVHVQLAWQRPRSHDMPGVVTQPELAQALADYPDPRLVLGPLY